MICQILYSNLHFLEVNNLFHLACIKLKPELACKLPQNLLCITFQPVRMTTFRSTSDRIIKFSLKYSTLHVKVILQLLTLPICVMFFDIVNLNYKGIWGSVINIWNSVNIGMQVCSFKWCVVVMMMMTAQPT